MRLELHASPRQFDAPARAASAEIEDGKFEHDDAGRRHAVGGKRRGPRLDTSEDRDPGILDHGGEKCLLGIGPAAGSQPVYSIEIQNCTAGPSVAEYQLDGLLKV